MPLSLTLCLLGFVFTVFLVRDRKPSLGLPVVYCFLLLLLHVPGAISHMQGNTKLEHAEFTEIGFRLTAIGVVAYVAGLWIARLTRPRLPRMALVDPGKPFVKFCLIWGWIVTFALRPFLVQIPSIGAAVDSGSKIWLVAIVIALPLAFHRKKILSIVFWLAATLVYPVIGLVGSGFLSYGSTTTVQAFTQIPVTMRSALRFFAIVPIVAFYGIGVFVTYFTIRNDIRDVVWGGGTLEERTEESARVVTEFTLIDPEDEEHLDALNQRLNQNVFVGMAAYRLDIGMNQFYEGRTLLEGFYSLIPRLFWLDKPVFGGSPKIVNEMTFFVVDEKTTSFGVGNVMEFYINWGMPSLILGFLIFGWFLGWLDHGAAKALIEGRLPALLRWILPAFAMIRPGESVVEIVGGGAAAWVAAVGWGMLWDPKGGGKERGEGGGQLAVGGGPQSGERVERQAPRRLKATSIQGRRPLTSDL